MNVFLPEGWRVRCAMDPEDYYASIITVKTPTGEVTMRKRAQGDVRPLILIKGLRCSGR